MLWGLLDVVGGYVGLEGVRGRKTMLDVAYGILNLECQQVNIVKAKHTRKIAVSRKEVKFIESFLISGTVDEVNKYLELNDPDFLKLVESTKQLPKYDEQF